MNKYILAFVILILMLSIPCMADGGNQSLKTFFPFGIWYQGCLTDKGMYQPTMAEDITALGMNFAIANANTNIAPNSTEPSSLSSMLSLADKTGLKMLVGLSPLVKVEISALKPDDFDKQREQLKAKLAPFIEEGRKHPSVLGWWLGDEPVTGGVERLKTAEKLRLLFAELDPDHPAWCEGPWSVLERDTAPHIANIQEPVYMPEVYPFWNRPYQAGIGNFRYGGFKPGGKGNEWQTRDVVEQYKEVRQYTKDRPVWPWLHCFREANFQEPGWDWRAPTPEELRCLSWISIAESCKGLCYFGYEHMRGFGDHANLFPELKKIIADVKPVSDVLLDCRPVKNIAYIKGGGSRYYKTALVETLEDSNGTRYIAVVNRNCEPNTVSKITVKVELASVEKGSQWLGVNPSDNSIIYATTSRVMALEFDMKPGDGKLIRIISSPELHPSIAPDAKTLRVGETTQYSASKGICQKAPYFYRWSVAGFPAGTIDALTGEFKATTPGKCTVWCRDASGNSAFTRDVTVVE